MDERAAAPVVGKTMEVAVLVVFLGVVSAALFGSVVPQYRTAAGAEIGDRVLVAAAGQIETAASGPESVVERRVDVSVPRTIRGAAYVVRAENRNGTFTLSPRPSERRYRGRDGALGPGAGRRRRRRVPEHGVDRGRRSNAIGRNDGGDVAVTQSRRERGSAGESGARRRRTQRDRRSRSRGQANLIAVAVALVLVTSVLGASVAIAERSLVGATEARDPADRRAAATLAARLVADAPASYPPGVIGDGTELTAEEVNALAPMAENASLSVELDGRTLFERGDPDGGVTVRRGILVGTATDRTAAIDLAADDAVTLPGRTGTMTLDLDPGPNTTIHTVRVNDRIVLHNDTGLSGEATVRTSVRRTTELAVETSVHATNGSSPAPSTPTPVGPSGRVEVSYTTVDGEPATLVVTVDV
ncbi:DUF7263 family protein [Salinigranum sp. GCM10025319]|uniref:DUF7263 family protein n=1 Tax=Salinigranum sp. GCM10025319 TaxID=3252687 RepID=UPI0036235F08